MATMMQTTTTTNPAVAAAVAAAAAAIITPEQKATRDLIATLLDARTNLSRRLKEIADARAAKEAQAIKDLSNPKASTDQILNLVRTLATVVEQSKKDSLAVSHARELIVTQLHSREKNNASDVLAVCLERIGKLKLDLATKEIDQKPLEEELHLLNKEIGGLHLPKQVTAIQAHAGNPRKQVAKASATKASATKASATKASATKASATKASATKASATKASATKASATKASATKASATKASATKASVAKGAGGTKKSKQ
jgi:hypothetical protein